MSALSPAGTIRTLATGPVGDAVISTDGATLYTTGGGTLNAYDIASGTLLRQWSLGTKLGGIDVSPDGRYLVATDQVAGPSTTSGAITTTDYYVYRVDLQTGSTQTFTSHDAATFGYSSYYHDISYLSNGMAILSQDYPGSGFVPLTTLDFSTGTFTASQQTYAQDGLLVGSRDRSHIFFAPSNISDEPAFIYTAGEGITASHGEYQDNVMGYNDGVGAISPDGSIVVQGPGLNVYDGNLNFEGRLGSKYPMAAAGMVFDPSGTDLYVLDANSDEVVELKVADWSVVRRFSAGTDVAAAGSSFGNVLQITPDGHTLSVIGTDAVQLIDLTKVQDQGSLTTAALNEASFISGVDGTGRVAAQSFATWTGTYPAQYSSSDVSLGKWGAEQAGTPATVTYSFAAGSHWTSTEKAAFTAGLDLYSAEAGLTFDQVASGGEILFVRGSDKEAETTTSYGDTPVVGSTTVGSLEQAGISIDTSAYGFGPIGASFSSAGGYPWMTLLHEEGHAIGLGHAGAYNDDGDSSSSEVLPFTAYDSRAYSVMSYLDASDTGAAATPAGGFEWDDVYGDENSPTTPMLLDILAAERLYGAPTSTPLSGGQVFGFDSNIGGDIRQFFDFTVNTQPIVTLFDTGDGNTLDLSGYGTASTVDLRQGDFSSVGGLTNNIAIAYGTRIDTAIGGSGSDRIVANDDGDTLAGGAGDDVLVAGAGHDSLTGGGGADSFTGTRGSLAGDTITDLTPVDRIVFTDPSLGNFAYALNNNILSYTGGSLTLANVPNWHFTASADAAGGVDLRLTTPAPDDFNGDGLSDILWRNDNGALTDWLGTATGGFAYNSASAGAFAAVGTDWHVVGTGDFNGDGRADILWRNDSGALTDWLGTASGGFVDNSASAYAVVGTDWKVADTGDFNGDGRIDILWRDDDGALTDWLGTASGGFVDNALHAYATVATNWHIQPHDHAL